MRHLSRFLTLALLAMPAGATAQLACGSIDQCSPPPPFDTGVRQELTTAGINAVLGGVSAVLTRVVRGEAVGNAFWKGAVGGGVVYAGKRLAVERFDGAGLLGREVASMGGSIVRNAAAGRGTLEELVFPLGPVRLYVSREHGAEPHLDVGTLVASAAFVLAYDARLDPAESLSAGALVWRGGTPMPGLSSAGALAIWADEDMPIDEGPRLIAHERVHVLQYDQAFLSWGEGIERWLLGQSMPHEGILNHLDFGAVALGIRSGLAMTLHYQDRPWETEAYFLAQAAHPLSGGDETGL